MEVAGLDLVRDALVAIIEPEASLIHRDLLGAEPAGFSDITRAQLEAGLAIPAVDYLEALQVRDLLHARFRRAFEFGRRNPLALRPVGSAGGRPAGRRRGRRRRDAV